VVVEFEEHPSKAAAWRAGRFVVLPDAELEDCTVWVGADADSDGLVRWEGLLARRLSSTTARICAVPFWAYDLNLGDEVELIESAEGASVVTGVAVDAGNYTFRVLFADPPLGDERWRELMIELEPFDCWCDVRGPGFVAVSAPGGHAQSRPVSNWSSPRCSRSRHDGSTSEFRVSRKAAAERASRPAAANLVSACCYAGCRESPAAKGGLRRCGNAPWAS